MPTSRVVVGAVPIGPGGLALPQAMRAAIRQFGVPIRLHGLHQPILDRHRLDQPVGWIESASIMPGRVVLIGGSDVEFDPYASQAVQHIRETTTRIDPGVTGGQTPPARWTVADLLDAAELSTAPTGLPQSRWRS